MWSFQSLGTNSFRNRFVQDVEHHSALNFLRHNFNMESLSIPRDVKHYDTFNFSFHPLVLKFNRSVPLKESSSALMLPIILEPREASDQTFCSFCLTDTRTLFWRDLDLSKWAHSKNSLLACSRSQQVSAHLSALKEMSISWYLRNYLRRLDLISSAILQNDSCQASWYLSTFLTRSLPEAKTSSLITLSTSNLLAQSISISAPTNTL